ncbi:MAG: hypothetical protein LBU64_02465 [Planctomycetota bacterium]|jgi:hypothetical protein|nr:hypothetical protein [Planctomycetota bacterium]
MLKIPFLIAILAILAAFPGCGKIAGPRFWWDDQAQARLPEDYRLPDDPGAPPGGGSGPGAKSSGRDVSEENLRDYRTNLDLEEEKQKSDAALLDF